MQYWKWLLVAATFAFSYAIGFLWIYGWIVVSVIAPIVAILMFINPGGTIQQDVKKLIAFIKSDRKREKKLKDDYRVLANEVEGKVIAVGLSGGVDSAVAAYLLKKDGYKVKAFFMKNWDKSANKEFNADQNHCQATQDFEDAKKVAEFIGIELHFVDFVSNYWEEVFQPYVKLLKEGLTPNPDILCNKYIKFNRFIKYIEMNFPDIDYIATGHYAHTNSKGDEFFLRSCKDTFKDQTYFLAEIDKAILPKLMFPLAPYLKTEVRQIAKEANLPVFAKPDSTGICFIGERNYANFMENYIKPVEGDIFSLDENKPIGKHKGVWFYTLGQNKGLNLGGYDKPHFVISKDIEKNILNVSSNQELLLSNTVVGTNINWLVNKKPKVGSKVSIKVRHSEEKYDGKVVELNETEITIVTNEKIKGVTPGQELVVYDNFIVLCGSRILSKSNT